MKKIIDETIEEPKVIESKPLTGEPNAKPVTTEPKKGPGWGIVLGILILAVVVAAIIWAVSYFKKKREQKLLADGTGTK